MTNQVLMAGSHARAFSRAAAIIAIAGGLSFSALAGPKEDIEAAMKAHDWQRADEMLQKTLAGHPKNAMAHYWRAEVQLELGGMEIADEELQAAKRIDPDHTFASSAEGLARLESAINAGKQSKVAQARSSAPVETAPQAPLAAAAQSEQVAPPLRAEPEPRPSKLRWGYIFLALFGVVVVIWLFAASGRRKAAENLERERARVRDMLNDVSGQLQTAMKWSDGQAELSQEQRLGNHDVLNSLRSQVDAAIAGLPRATEFTAALELVDRVPDEIATMRGEEKPSERRAREAEAESQRQHELDMERARASQSAGYAQGPVVVRSGGGGIGDVATGFVLGSMLSGHREGSARPGIGADYDNRPLHIDEERQSGLKATDEFEVDVGGQASGDGDFGFDPGGGNDSTF
ncbi:MAG: tetratricopeptide repeat protein [Paucibacter sp.]|nr:tetratricopeptide repeat protein [Roseateles sp.]